MHGGADGAVKNPGTPEVAAGSCSSLPPASDYSAKGPFDDAKMFENTGPNGQYLLYRPDASLGKNGFKHPLAVWGNGIATTADQYQELLTLIASHGFVIIACPDVQAERQCLNDGMDWLVQQNTADGPLKDMLDTSTEVTIGYSWGGGAAVDTANRPNVKATVSFHGMPPREGDAWQAMHAPLLLFSSTGDTFVSADGYVTPNFNASQVQTFYAILQMDVGHLYIIDTDAISCIASAILSGPCGGAEAERGYAVAWLRYWACGDTGARKYFFGSDCELCTSSEWQIQKKNWPSPDTP
ncbi:MAG TPA: dienelactone hydrolase family protein [Polyangiaceae bacterium]|nr:dienelactone hydrolase family protein [Polyangiaceae bacterium]